MTPIDITHFSNLLFQQMEKSIPNIDLSSTAPLYTIEHPAIIKDRLNFKTDSPIPNILNIRHSIHFLPIESIDHLRPPFSNQPIIKGTPANLWNFLMNNTSSLFDFGALGYVFLSKECLKTNYSCWGLQAHLMSTWLDYALSPELWSHEGKWIRFHNRLNSFLKKYNLLVEDGRPGFYPLNPKVKFLETSGFHGDETLKSFNITLPWDFSQTQLDKLEAALIQE